MIHINENIFPLDLADLKEFEAKIDSEGDLFIESNISDSSKLAKKTKEFYDGILVDAMADIEQIKDLMSDLERKALCLYKNPEYFDCNLSHPIEQLYYDFEDVERNVSTREAQIFGNLTYEDALKLVQKNGLNLKLIPTRHKDDALCQTAVENNGQALEFIPEHRLTDKIIETSLLQDGTNLTFLSGKMRTFERCKMAFEQTEKSFKFIPGAVLQQLGFQKIKLNNNVWRVIDSWNVPYLGNVLAVKGVDDDGDWYAARAEKTPYGVMDIEFGNELPSREKIIDAFEDKISSLSIDEHERIYGADGELAFPHLNDEPKDFVKIPRGKSR